jgi:thiamine pyrophosphokinase
MSGSSEGWVLVVADGDGVDAALPAALLGLAGRPYVLAADAGARRALDAGVIPDLVVGDGDSLGPAAVEELRSRGIRVEVAPVDKDESDTELCLRAAVDRGARVVRIVGALGGGRVEHAVANLLLLAHPMLDGIDVAIVAPPSVIRRAGTAGGPGSLALAGRPGDHVSLLAVDTVVEGVRTDGLRFPLRGEPLRPGPARGLSNELTGTAATVTTGRGRLLVIHTARTHPASEPIP